MGLGICHTCDAIILFGGIRRDGYHYCSRRCAEEAEMGRAVEMVPEEVAEQEAMRVRGDPCPDCGRARRICCRFCGARHALRAIAHSLLFGWWGFPLGPILTPIVVLRDLFVMIPRVRRSPSPALVEAVRLDIAAGVLAQGQLPPVPLLPSGD